MLELDAERPLGLHQRDRRDAEGRQRRLQGRTEPPAPTRRPVERAALATLRGPTRTSSQAPTGPTMDLSIASILLLDGVTNGAVYALLALATGAGLRRHARHLHPAGRVRRLRRAHAGDAAARQDAGHGVAAADPGRHRGAAGRLSTRCVAACAAPRRRAARA